MRMNIHLIQVAGLAAAFAAGCGTYSMVRPASTLPAGKIEIAGGLATSALGEVNTIAHGAYGVTDRVEVLVQNEVWNTFGEVRFGLLDDETAPVSLAIGVGGGAAVTLLSAVAESDMRVDGGVGVASVAVGRRWDRFELTLANRSFVFVEGFIATSTRLGVRMPITGRLG